MNHQFNKDILKLFSPDKEPFAVYSAPINQCFKVTIDDEFREVSQFAELVDVLDNAQEGDIVHIKLSTVGGALHAIIPLISAMKATQAFIHTHVESDTASAGTMIMALSHSLYVNEYATIMYHNIQYQAHGHGGNVEAQVRHTSAGSKQLIRDLYADLLTSEEIKRLEDGLELYLTAEECMERFVLREEIRSVEESPDNEFILPSKEELEKLVFGGAIAYGDKASSNNSPLYSMPEDRPLTGIDSAWDNPKPAVEPAKKPRKKK